MTAPSRQERAAAASRRVRRAKDRPAAARVVTLPECRRLLTAARRAARDATNAKTRFLAVTSHEMRTPLNAIIGMADLLWQTELAPEQREYARVIRNASEELLHLIDDILDISRLERRRVELEQIPFELLSIVEDACDVMALQAHRKRLEVVARVAPELPSVLLGDPSRLRQVLTNLIGNAIKFTAQGTVRVDVTRLSNERRARRERRHAPIKLLFTVADTGAGIPPERLEAVFELFTQGNISTTREHGGAGLGLSIARQLVKLMRGRIWVESVIGRGTTFRFTATFAREPEVQPPQVQPLINGNPRVLIVDDNADTRAMLSELLAHAGVDASEAIDGNDALARVTAAEQRGQPFHVLMLDAHMTNPDCEAVLADVRGHRGIGPAAIMLLTTEHRIESEQRCRNANAAALYKPVRRQRLLDVLHQALAGIAATEGTLRTLPQPMDATDLKPLRVLLAEDNADNRLLVERYLRGHHIDAVGDGAQAVDKARTGMYDVILMDINMPVLDGFNATKQIRAWERANGLRPMPIIALTAHAFSTHVQESLDAGCTAHLCKPFRKDALLAALATCCRATQPTVATPEATRVARATSAPRIIKELQDLVPAFLAHRREDVAILRTALAAGDYDTVGRIGHTMKGTGASYGFDEITSLGAALERAAAAADRDGVAAYIEELAAYLKRITTN
jgi:signal transduction histidine kinase/DNA-binding response OmpR family regulator